jgi:hypothetical protein
MIIGLGIVGGLASGLAASYNGMGEGVIMAIGIIASVVIMFMIAIKSHLIPMQIEHPDIVAMTDGRINRGRFIMVFILVTIAAAIPIVFNVFISADLVSIAGIQIKSDLNSDAVPTLVKVLLLGGLTIFILIALSPFIPRALSIFTSPIKDQIAVNLSNWKRGLLYIAVFAFIPHFILSSLATALMFWFMISLLAGGKLFFVLIGCAMFLTTALNGISLVLMSTAFSMHFLDTITDETVDEDA